MLPYSFIPSLVFTVCFVICSGKTENASTDQRGVVAIWGIAFSFTLWLFLFIGTGLSQRVPEWASFIAPLVLWGCAVGMPGLVTAALLGWVFGRPAALGTAVATGAAIFIFLVLRPDVASFLSPLIWNLGVLLSMAISLDRAPRPGCCAACSYDLCGLDVERCPECGTPVGPPPLNLPALDRV